MEKELKKYEDLDISKEAKRALADIGYINMTEIQEKAIPEVLSGRDLIGQSQTGTGKTAAFGIPMIEKLDRQDKSTQAIILCPTRELAVQVSEEIRKYTKYMENVKILAIYGGQSIENQIRELKRGVQIVVGTPGRVMDHMRRKTLKLQNVSTVILDEADEMLNMGFEEDIETILMDVPKERQTLLFSATMNKKIMNITKKYINDPVKIKIESKELTVENITQEYIEIKAAMKNEALTKIFDFENPKKVIVFCNTKRKCDDLVEFLQRRNYLAENLHGDMKQMQRDKILRKLKSGEIKILVATDVVARGIDVEELELVVNYDLPQEEEYYVHRIGRTGRNGAKGKAITFVTGREKTKLKNLERYANIRINKGTIPSTAEVNSIKNKKFENSIREVLEAKNFKNLEVLELIKADNDIENIAKALITMLGKNQVVKIESDSRDSRDSRNTRSEDRKPRERRDYQLDSNSTKLFLNLGKQDGVGVKDIVGSIASNVAISYDEIGDIRLLDKFAFIEIPTKYVKDVIRDMKDKTIKGKDVKIEIANS